jgi:long-chain acyl-CoA synthetase
VAGAWRWTTYAELGALVDAFRGGLASVGVGVGDRVAIVSGNRLEWAVAAYATFGLGASLVPMYEAQLPEEWLHILSDCGAKVVIASKAHIVDQLDAMRARVPSIRHVVSLEGRVDDPRSYAALLARGRETPVPSQGPEGDAIACFIYTSGTTGKPKGVLLSHGNLTSNIAASATVFPLTPEDRTLSFLPWAHAYGQVVEVHFLVSCGASTALNSAVPQLMAELLEVRPTMLVAVPRIFNRIYAGVLQQMEERPRFIRWLFQRGIALGARRNRGEKLRPMESLRLALADRLIFSKIRAKLGGRLKYALTASAAIDPHVAETIDAIGIQVCEGYGLTETSPVVSGNYPGMRRIGSVGKPLPGVRVSLETSLGHAPGEGEIIVFGPNVMKGYHNRPEETASALLPSGGLRTGDLGRFDADGFLYITGRIKEQYKLENGKYVMPSPLEEQLKLSPFIANVMIHGENKPFNVAIVVPDLDAVRRWATRTGVTIGPDPATDPSVRKLIEDEIERCASGFKGYERPRGFVLTLEDFTGERGLLTPTLKVKRRNVLERHAASVDALYRVATPVAAPWRA